MKTKQIPLLLASLALGLSVFGMTGCDKPAPVAGATQTRQYTCPMHPDVVKDAPGNCPKCGMKLVEKK